MIKFLGHSQMKTSDPVCTAGWSDKWSSTSGVHNHHDVDANDDEGDDEHDAQVGGQLGGGLPQAAYTITINQNSSTIDESTGLTDPDTEKTKF